MSEQATSGSGAVNVARRPTPELSDDQLATIDVVAGQAKKPEAYWIGEAFAKRAADDELTDAARAAWRLLADVMRMQLRANNASEPFGALVILADGSRSLTPGDVEADQRWLLQSALGRVSDCEVTARLADALWVSTGEPDYAREAIRGYLASAERLEDPQHWPPAVARFERAARVARMLGRNEPMLSEALERFVDRIRDYRGRDPLFLTCQLAKLLYEFRHGDPVELAGYTMTGAEGAHAARDFNRARQYYEIAAKLYGRARDQERFRRSRLAIAETFCEEAEFLEAQGNVLASHHAWTSAILAFRKAPSGSCKVPALQARLQTAAERMREQMQGFQHEVDFTEVTKQAVASVTGLGIGEAMLQLTAWPCIDVKALRASAIQEMQDFPLQGLMPTKIFDGRGRLVDQAPPALGHDANDQEAALQVKMMRNADLHRWHVFHAHLQPVFYKMAEEHQLAEPQIWELIKESSFIPPYREEFYVRGLAAGFRGDLLLGLHLLIPQLENSLRWILHQLGIIPRAIDDTGIEEEWPLHRCLTASKTVEIFGEDLTYELRTLLIEKGGSNLRHLSAHGIMSSSEFRSLPSFYTWWLILKMTFFLTPAIQQRAASRRGRADADGEEEKVHPSEPPNG